MLTGMERLLDGLKGKKSFFLFLPFSECVKPRQTGVMLTPTLFSVEVVPKVIGLEVSISLSVRCLKKEVKGIAVRSFNTRKF